jgi:hypothetical protein
MLLDLDAPQRYRPNNISGLCSATGYKKSRENIYKNKSSLINCTKSMNNNLWR